MLFFLEIARYACLVGLNAIERELASFSYELHARWNGRMQARKSLHAFNLLYMCKAEKLLPGRNAFSARNFLLQLTCINAHIFFLTFLASIAPMLSR